MNTSFAMRLPLVVALLALGACVSPATVAQRPSADPAITCAAWTGMTEGQRISHADALVGDSADLLDRIRTRQHRPAGTERDALIRDVAQSVTKGCEVWATPDQSVDEVMHSLY